MLLIPENVARSTIQSGEHRNDSLPGTAVAAASSKEMRVSAREGAHSNYMVNVEEKIHDV